ncbi:hypothetical protein D8674_033344 [Pyrus ussuriensis x Pyrus communis]|uniref:Uncharacterized protein n=1 Tax=Pyrus ussuriensis x Pyrus communis TaxID=2448454 RepID=A0A5N5HKV7_9ROSA|nr:hypothetical protein D8674_033344 [Pyrus ussuriensis x Pyrus communis]
MDICTQMVGEKHGKGEEEGKETRMARGGGWLRWGRGGKRKGGRARKGRGKAATSPQPLPEADGKGVDG